MSRFEKGHIPYNRGKSKYGNNLTIEERNRRKSKIYYETNKEEISERQKKWYQINKHIRKIKTPEEVRIYRYNLKVTILTHYSNGTPICKCCGEIILEFLTIDHINNDGKKQREKIKGTYSFYLWIKRNKYPKDLQVLCMNCNWGRAKEIDNVCPHKKVKNN